MERQCRSPGEDSEGDAEGECGSEMAERAGEARALHPSNLVLDGGDETLVDHDVVDNVIAENDGVAFLCHQVSQHEIVGAIIAENAESADLVNTLFADHHGWSQRKAHTL